MGGPFGALHRHSWFMAVNKMGDPCECIDMKTLWSVSLPLVLSMEKPLGMRLHFTCVG